ncbi:MAG: hypothetical protein AAGH53_02770 [Pseudomonadota bacterium]
MAKSGSAQVIAETNREELEYFAASSSATGSNTVAVGSQSTASGDD